MKKNIDISLLELETHQLFNLFGPIFGEIIEQIANQKIQNQKILKYEYYKQEYLKRFHNYFIAIKTIYDGADIIYCGESINISLLPSVFSLIRSSLENFALFNHIYNFPNMNGKSEFRFDCWWREGLLKRQKYISEIDEFKKKIKEEKKSIDEIYQKWMNSKYFNEFSESQRKSFEKTGKWYFVGYKDLIYQSGFDKNTAYNIYNHLCSYTHTSSIGLMQTSQADPREVLRMQESFIKMLFIAAGKYLSIYQNIFKQYNFNLSQNDIVFINTWSSV